MRKRLLLWMGTISFALTGVTCSGVSQIPNPAQATPQVVEKHLSAFRPIEGTNYMIANISGTPPTRDRGDLSPFSWIDSGYSGYSGYEIHNFVFFNSDSETFNRLLPTNDYVVLQIIGFPTGTQTESLEEFRPVQWWLFVLAKADTDKNGALNYEDSLTLGVTDVGGDNPVELISEVDSVLGHALKGENTLFVIYHSRDRNYVAKIDLPGRQVVSTSEMQLGEDVK